MNVCMCVHACMYECRKDVCRCVVHSSGGVCGVSGRVHVQCIYLLPTGRGDISLFFLLMGDRDGERDSSRLPLPLPLRIGDLDPPRLSLCTGLREAKLRRLKMGERERDLLLCREGKTPDTHISPTYMYICTYTHTSHSLTLTLSHCLSLSHSQSHSLSLTHTHTHTSLELESGSRIACVYELGNVNNSSFWESEKKTCEGP